MRLPVMRFTDLGFLVEVSPTAQQLLNNIQAP